MPVEYEQFKVGDIVRWKRQLLTENLFTIFLTLVVESGETGSGFYKVTAIKEVSSDQVLNCMHNQTLTLEHIYGHLSGETFTFGGTADGVPGFWFQKH